jgi:tRNA-splicing ligase RtcB
VFDAELARAFGLAPGQVAVMFHCGSRGFGHQVATDYLQRFLRAMPTKFGLPVIDRELACAPIGSTEGREYHAAMCCAANMSFANRQVILHRVREAFASLFWPEASARVRTVYVVAHNTAKFERHRVAGWSARCWCTARARRAPSRRATPSCRRPIVQPGSPG